MIHIWCKEAVHTTQRISEHINQNKTDNPLSNGLLNITEHSKTRFANTKRRTNRIYIGPFQSLLIFNQSGLFSINITKCERLGLCNMKYTIRITSKSPSIFNGPFTKSAIFDISALRTLTAHSVSISHFNPGQMTMP